MFQHVPPLDLYSANIKRCERKNFHEHENRLWKFLENKDTYIKFQNMRDVREKMFYKDPLCGKHEKMQRRSTYFPTNMRITQFWKLMLNRYFKTRSTYFPANIERCVRQKRSSTFYEVCACVDHDLLFPEHGNVLKIVPHVIFSATVPGSSLCVDGKCCGIQRNNDFSPTNKSDILNKINTYNISVLAGGRENIHDLIILIRSIY